MNRLAWPFWVLTLLCVGLFVFIFMLPALDSWARPRPSPLPQPVYCTQDAMQCPDGSYVGRVPPSCAFRACPTAMDFGTVSGSVLIGPLCPVEPCNDESDPYSARTLIFTPQDPSLSIEYAFLSPDGAFRHTLHAGTYSMRMWPCAEMGCRMALPQTVVVPADGEVRLVVDIDTGIR